MDLDPTDVAILRCLQADARMSFRNIAKAIGVSTPTVSARVSSLERTGIVKGYAAQVDPERLNETAVTLVIRARLPAAELVADDLARLPWVRKVSLARGGRIVVDATAVRASDLNALFEAVGKLPDVIDADHYVTVKTVKEEPRAVLADHLTATLTCFECKGPIAAEPVRRRIDGRDHYFCCRSCEFLYVKRYERTKARAAKTPRRR